MEKKSLVVISALLVLGAGVTLHYWLPGNKSPAPTDTQAQPTAVIANSPTSKPLIQYPVPTGAPSTTLGSSLAKKTLPALDDSDESLQDVLNTLFGKSKLESLIHVNGLIRRFVLNVENATGPHPAPADATLFIPAKGTFRITGQGEDQTLSPQNYKRYLPYVSLLDQINSKKLVTIYVHFYPLFQAAYHDLSPRGYFNDRLIEVIDDLLKSPEAKAPIKLTLNNLYYKFADPKLEAASTGQKILIRIGSANAKVVKAKLKDVRDLLAVNRPT